MNISEKYVDALKAKSEVNKGTTSEWNSIVGELTDFLNKERDTKYPPLQPKRVAMLISYIREKGGYTDLRRFKDDVLSKGSWFFWFIVKPKKDPQGNIK